MEQPKTPALLAPAAGGFFAGILMHNNEPHALIIAPKASGELSDIAWHDSHTNIPTANSYTDGHANTVAMAEAGSELAQKILKLEINGFADWALPARDQLELMYRNAKPGTEENWCSFRDGDNPSSVPAGYPYTAELPQQVAANEFKSGGTEAFEEAWYWASTQYSAGCAWFQDFNDGTQCNRAKAFKARARAVRMIPLSNLVI